jgi:S1-C subfamily serine protease
MPQDDDVLEIVEKATRSVVNINTVRVFQDVYYRVVPVKGMGSGFIYNSDGYILTNAHVVDGSERIGAVMGDGRVLEGRLVGACQSHDVAVVRVEGDGLAVAQDRKSVV